MENPWKKLNTEKEPYILDSDKEIINKYNKKRTNKDYLIRLDNLPTPYAGDFDKAKILLLQLNPGSEILPGLEPTENHEFLVYKNLKDVLIKSLWHENMDFPFYWLNPEFMLTGGFKYWTRIFSTLIKSKIDYKKIANKVCCVQYFPYHSKRYQHINKILDSQKYSYDLVRKFIKRPDKMVIIMRSPKRWLDVIPELNKIYIADLKNNRNPVLSRNNFKKVEDFNRFVEYLEI
ncbi:MAG: hypothetical protein WC349_04835 [Patescibacteria group bacterium]|jgi:hypothetical protein